MSILSPDKTVDKFIAYLQGVQEERMAINPYWQFFNDRLLSTLLQEYLESISADLTKINEIEIIKKVLKSNFLESFNYGAADLHLLRKKDENAGDFKRRVRGIKEGMGKQNSDNKIKANVFYHILLYIHDEFIDSYTEESLFNNLVVQCFALQGLVLFTKPPAGLIKGMTSSEMYKSWQEAGVLKIITCPDVESLMVLQKFQENTKDFAKRVKKSQKEIRLMRNAQILEKMVSEQLLIDPEVKQATIDLQVAEATLEAAKKKKNQLSEKIRQEVWKKAKPLVENDGVMTF